jgi:hypothetical protein
MAVEHGLQRGVVVGLLGILAEEILADGERGEDLVVQVVAVGEDEDLVSMETGLLEEAGCDEGHEQGLSGALGVDVLDPGEVGIALGEDAEALAQVAAEQVAVPVLDVEGGE